MATEERQQIIDAWRWAAEVHVPKLVDALATVQAALTKVTEERDAAQGEARAWKALSGAEPIDYPYSFSWKHEHEGRLAAEAALAQAREAGDEMDACIGQLVVFIRKVARDEDCSDDFAAFSEGRLDAAIARWRALASLPPVKDEQGGEG